MPAVLSGPPAADSNPGLGILASWRNDGSAWLSTSRAGDSLYRPQATDRSSCESGYGSGKVRERPTSLSRGGKQVSSRSKGRRSELGSLKELVTSIAWSEDEQLVKSKRRVADHGEVFTPAWVVDTMLDLVESDAERIDSRFLEPACGSGNFIVPVFRRKLATVESKFGKSAFQRSHYALLALMCIYGIELLPDNVAECRDNMLRVLADYLAIDECDDVYRAGRYVLSQNLIHGDALSMRTHERQAITFAEWGYLGKGKYQRRDFRLDMLARSAEFGEEATLFDDRGKHEIFVPLRAHPPVSVRELAVLDRRDASGRTPGEAP